MHSKPNKTKPIECKSICFSTGRTLGIGHLREEIPTTIKLNKLLKTFSISLTSVFFLCEPSKFSANGRFDNNKITL